MGLYLTFPVKDRPRLCIDSSEACLCVCAAEEHAASPLFVMVTNVDRRGGTALVLGR